MAATSPAARLRDDCGSGTRQGIANLQFAIFLALLLLPATLFAQISIPEGSDTDPIVIRAQAANQWQQDKHEVWLLRGDCRLMQGDDVAVCQEAVFWIEHAPAGSHERSKVIAYLEGNVGVHLIRNHQPVEIRDQKWFGRFSTVREVQVSAGIVAGKPNVLPGIYQRGMEQRKPEVSDALQQNGVNPAQYIAANELPPPGQPSPSMGPLPPGTPPVSPGTRRFRISSRSEVPMQGQWQQDPQTHQAVAVASQGVTMVVEGLPVRKGSIPGVANGLLTIDLSTDRLVVWTVSENQPDIKDAVVQDEDKPLEVYMEGHVVFREGERIVYADRMYYDVQHNVGTVLDAEMLTPAPGYEGKLRVRAAELQIFAKDHFRAQDAWFTSSRLGLPRVRVQASQAEFTEIPVFDPVTGVQTIDPRTGQPARKQMVSAQNDVVYVEDVPIFYWPTFATDLSDPTFFLRRIQFVENGVFGTQILTDWAAYQLLGIKDRPQGTDWTLSLNYMSARGLSEGTEFDYERDDFFGLVNGKVAGKIIFWGIEDRGTDNLGEGRSSVLPEPDVPYRFRFVEQHRQDLGEGFTFTAEVGKISDRNFLLEYFKPDWDEQKDPSTDLDLTLRRENMSMSIMGEARLDNFVTDTQWLPRFDHYLLGESLPGVPLTWFEHTSLGYAQFKVATLPSAAAGDEAVSHLPWEPRNFSGGRFVTRNELDLPIELGPLKVVPYGLGEVGYWGEDIDGQPLTRVYYQAGIRATLPMWAVDCEAESELWNVHGLAHKVEFQAEYFHAQADQSMTQFPLYDPLDDNQIEDFRRRFVVNTYGFPAVPPPLTQGPPTKFDERYYALRNDMEGWVTAPSMEIADDLDEVRLGIHERWQTKRGPEDNPHIIDWVEFDTDVTLFPNANRDNFGTSIGLTDYNFVWHVGDRLTLLSDGIFDFFGQGQKIVTAGMFLTRPPRGAFYMGFRVLEGPISSEVLAMSYSYWMSPKWITTCGMSIDLKQPENVSPTFQLIRVGESLLVGLNMSYNPALNTSSVGLTVEPRFIPKAGNLSKLPGVHVGQAGEFGVE